MRTPVPNAANPGRNSPLATTSAGGVPSTDMAFALSLSANAADDSVG